MPKDLGNGWVQYKYGEKMPEIDPNVEYDDDVSEMWRSYKQMRKENRHKALAAFEQENWEKIIEEKTGLIFMKHTQFHYSALLHDFRLDYWPSTNKWRWKGKNYNGRPYHLVSFIRNRLNQATKGTTNGTHDHQEPKDVQADNR